MGKKLSEMSLEELWELFPIVLKDHNPYYREWYLSEKTNIENTVPVDCIKRISHIGSSAVNGLISKPTVDILLEINRNCVIEKLKTSLINSGWVLMSCQDGEDLRMSFNKGYTPEGFAEKVFHLHIRFPGDWDELYFRDYLRGHKEVADEYGRLKIKLKEQYEHDRDGYTEAKAGFVKKWTKKAREDFKDRYLP